MRTHVIRHQILHLKLQRKHLNSSRKLGFPLAFLFKDKSQGTQIQCYLLVEKHSVAWCLTTNWKRLEFEQLYLKCVLAFLSRRDYCISPWAFPDGILCSLALQNHHTAAKFPVSLIALRLWLRCWRLLLVAGVTCMFSHDAICFVYHLASSK